MILLFSHSGFSDTDANGITMKNLLSAYDAQEKAQFYCDSAAADFTAAHHYFRVTDMQMVKAFLLKKSRHIFTYSPEMEQKSPPKAAAKVPGYFKKRKYNFFLKWLRERLWCISPWGHRALRRWIAEQNPEAIVYMVGESHFMDKQVLKTCKKTGKPLILYHGEAYRIIDLKSRKGLERAYYRKSHKLYRKLNDRACLVMYNCELLRKHYEARYPKKSNSIVVYNSAELLDAAPALNKPLKITYFGNLGVGRDESLLTVARCLQELDPSLRIDVYGKALPEIEQRLRSCEGIRYCGFVQHEELREVMLSSDILLHVESFREEIMPKLRYAFSTKLAQCLCAGRCFVSFAPEQTASTQYLLSIGAPVATQAQQLKPLLGRLIQDADYRNAVAQELQRVGRENHDRAAVSKAVRAQIEAAVQGAKP